jgi:clan AA aspartic protease (TIGR02281 family)
MSTHSKGNCERTGVARSTVIFIVASLAWASLIGQSIADLYVWRDQSGTTHFTDNFGDVPPEYRDAYHVTATSPWSGSAKPAGSVVIPFERTSEGLIVVAVVLNERVKAKMIVDTGANIVVVTEDVSGRLDREPSSQGEVARLLTNCGEVEGRQLTIRKIALGDAWKENVPSIVALNTVALKGFDGLLGLSFLADFKMMIDYQRSLILLNR